MASPASVRWKGLLALILLVPAPSLGVLAAMALEPTRGTAVGQAVYVLSKAWILILPLAWMTLVDRQKPGLSPVRQGGMGAGALSGILIALAIGAAYWFRARPFLDVEIVRQAALRNGIGAPARYIGFALALTLVNSLLEEYVWRWFVFRKCETLLGGPLAVIASALFFTLHHIVALKLQFGWGVTLLASLGVFAGGCTWSWLYLRYRSVWPGWLSHVFADVAVFAVGWHIIFVASGASGGGLSGG